MAKYTYAIMGATGRIGHVIAEELMAKGHFVRAIGRNKGKLEKLKAKGAKTFSIEFDDAAALSEIFRGCHGVFSFLPPAYFVDDYEGYLNKVGEAIHKAIVTEKIQHVINLSSLGANQKEGTGPILLLHKHEKRLNAIPDLDILHFRPGYFMENLLLTIPVIKNNNIYKSGLRGDVPISFVSERDSGLRIAEFFNELKFKGQAVFEFLGPKGYTMVAASTILGKAIGKPELKYQKFSDDELAKSFQSMGMKPNLVTLLIEMYASINEGKALPIQPMTANHLGKTTLEDFSKIFAEAYARA